jgi:hypothetical protein
MCEPAHSVARFAPIRRRQRAPRLGKVLASFCHCCIAARPSSAGARLKVVILPQRMEVRMKSILDPTFRYTSSANTDLRKAFARIRRETRRQTQVTTHDEPDTVKKVTPIFRGQRPAA